MSEAILTRPRPGLALLFIESLRAQWLFFVIPVCYVLTNLILLADVASYHPASLTGLVLGMFTLTIPAGLVAVFLFRLGQYALVIRPESPLRQLRDDIAGLLPALVVGLPLLVATLVFNKGMLELKPLIPAVNPFAWDETFMALDRALHFGVDPWRILQPVMGHDFVTFAVNLFYNFWFLALFGCLMWFGFAKSSSVTRTQFFLAYMLCWWVGGGLLAVAFSSAGPVYYSALGLAPDPYAELMSYLRDVDTRIPIWALDTQQLLWDGYTGKSEPIGISAFPSMHNASTLLFTLAAWRRSKGLGIAFAVYSCIILLGSIHLGWHYAVDSYAGLLLAALFWHLSGFIARRHEASASVRRLNESLAAIK